MSKRAFLQQSVNCLVLGALVPRLAHSASTSNQALVEGNQYRLVTPPQATQTVSGKIEVIEFFWYACPHCFALEPLLESWVEKLPTDVTFRRVHVAFRLPQHQQIHYTLEMLDKLDELGPKVFDAIHRQRKRMRETDEIAEWAASNGINKPDFLTAFSSDSVRQKMQQASETVAAFGIQAVPRLAINGKYVTSPKMAGSNEAAIAVTDLLIDRERMLS
ncbi:MAG: thiol:disulfide interchange protein DsbA/DsbL [Burkholderiaceae bacterium]